MGNGRKVRRRARHERRGVRPARPRWGVASGRYGAEQGDLPPQIAELIERIFRSTHILVTLKRDELIREGRGEELHQLVKSTRALQKSLLEGTDG